MDDYQRFLIGNQYKAAGTVTLIQENGHYKAFGEIAVLAGQLCGKEVLRIDRHRTVYLKPDDIIKLEQAGYHIRAI